MSVLESGFLRGNQLALRSLSSISALWPADRRKRAKSKVKSGEGDKGDRPRPKRKAARKGSKKAASRKGAARKSARKKGAKRR
jgi:hypothetical protein